MSNTSTSTYRSIFTIIHEPIPTIEVKKEGSITEVKEESIFEDYNLGTYTEYIKIKSNINLLYMFRWGTGNCQIGTMCLFKNALITSGYPDFKFDLEEIIKLLKKIQTHKPKSMWLIDIERASYAELIEQIFSKEDIVFKQEYTNANYTQMTMYLVKTNKFND
jgi:hypothetical protein